MACCIIAESGINHNGSLVTAKKMVDVAADAGADIVKFQAYVPDLNAEKGTELYKVLCENMLSYYDLRELPEYCKRKNIKFLCSAFDIPSVELLNSFSVDTFKIPSGQITDLAYLDKIHRTGKKVYLSTGMSDLNNVRKALQHLGNNVVLLHCNSAYPAPFEDVNLWAMSTLRNAFDLPVGFSDHTLGIEVAIAAVAMKAYVLEKHFTLDKKMDGPDHSMSLEPDELKNMVTSIRNIEKAMGDTVKCVQESEKVNLHRRK